MNGMREEADRLLVNIAINKYLDPVDGGGSREPFRQQLADILLAYIRTDNYWGAADPLRKLINTLLPLDFIKSILSLSDTPIPTTMGQPVLGTRGQLRRPWSEYEDMRLIAGIHRYGLMDFHVVAKFVGNGRTQWQCRQRWTRGIDPSISKEKWSESEDAKLIEAVKQFGSKQWKKVASQMPNRSDVQCRYRFLMLSRKSGFDADGESPDDSEACEKREKAPLPSIRTFDPTLDASPFLQMILCGN